MARISFRACTVTVSTLRTRLPNQALSERIPYSDPQIRGIIDSGPFLGRRPARRFRKIARVTPARQRQVLATIFNKDRYFIVDTTTTGSSSILSHRTLRCGQRFVGGLAKKPRNDNPETSKRPSSGHLPY